MAKWTLQQQLNAIMNRKKKLKAKIEALNKKKQAQEDKFFIEVGKLTMKYHNSGFKFQSAFRNQLISMINNRKGEKQND